MSDIEQEKAAASIEHKEHIDHPHHIGFHETDLEPMGLPTEVSPEDNKRIKRKIDWVLMPILGVITALQFLDKTMLAYSSIMGEQHNTSCPRHVGLTPPQASSTTRKSPCPNTLGLEPSSVSW
jgi:hypothetical protein